MLKCETHLQELKEIMKTDVHVETDDDEIEAEEWKLYYRSNRSDPLYKKSPYNNLHIYNFLKKI